MTMKRLTVFALALGLATPALAQNTPLDDQLAAMARPFLAAENPNGTPAKIDETLECVMIVLRPLQDDLKTEMLRQRTFDDALDAGVAGDPDIQGALEACF